MTLFNCDQKQARLAELEEQMNAADFWSNPTEANKVVSQLKSLRAVTEPLHDLNQKIEDARLLWDMAEEADDDDARQEVAGQLESLIRDADRLETASLLGGKYDHRNCYLTIYSREGGTEAQDWTEMLMRMYLYYCEQAGWSVTEVDKTIGDEAGLKDVTLHIKGPMAFGYLSAERGTHRLARVSPYNAQGKRQTSFAAVEVVPEFDDEGAFELDETKLTIEAFARSSGPGGQNVNKVATAIRLIYEHEGETLMVVCSNERKQEQNKRRAMGILMGRIELMEEERRQREVNDAKGGKLDMGWGTQIRSYVFYDNRVKDHRTGYEVGNPQRVMEGDLDGFIEAELKRRAKAASR